MVSGISIPLSGLAAIEERADELDQQYLLENRRQTSTVFAVLMVVQWVFGVGFAWFWSPFTWTGEVRSIHPHVYMAVLLGLALSSLPLFMAVTLPDHRLTPWVVVIAQMLWSALLIHLSGGRIETHFHVFGSLAFVAFYRDWRLLIVATLVVSLDHLLRGIFWPESVYGTINPEWWRFLEHASWVVFEDAVLAMACLRGVREMRMVARRQAECEAALADTSELNATLDQRVRERTGELERSNEDLTESMERLNTAQRQLIEASRLAGKADVATAVLHNVGNVLNSVNVSSGLLLDRTRSSKSVKLKRVVEVLEQPEVLRALEGQARAQKMPAFLAALDAELTQEQEGRLKELEALQRNVDHIKTIVSMQQAHAKGSGGVVETLALAEVVEDAVKLNAAAFERHRIHVKRDLGSLPPVMVDRHAVVQVVLNLLRNAQQAIASTDRGEGCIEVRLRSVNGFARLEVQDSGCGISSENLSRVFNHGFTTKSDGHGFGLHASANVAKELGGSLTCSSSGAGCGATFVLDIPLRVVRAAA